LSSLPGNEKNNKARIDSSERLPAARAAFPRLASRTAVLGPIAFLLAVVFCSGVARSSPQSQSPSAPASQPIQPAQATQSVPPEAKPAAPAQSVSDMTPPVDADSVPAIKPLAYDEIVVTAVGDVMLGTTFPDASGGDLPPNDGAGLLDEVTPILKRGDVVFGNLEGPLVEGGDSAKCHGKKEGTCYAFRVPTRYGERLKSAGFTVMGLANNHAMDFGAEGRASSRRVLDEQGIAHSGEVGDVAHLTAKGRKIDVISFATYPGAYNLLDLDDAMETVRTARLEADLVIVSFHGGAEGATHQHVAPGDEKFLGEDRGDLRKFTHAAVDAGAQLVLGSGPHVVRAMEVYHGKLIAYSLGNFATYGPFNLNGENGISVVLEAHLLPDGDFLRGQIYPVKQEKPGGPKLDPELKIVPILRALSHTDFPATGVVAGPRGELWLPGTRIPECSNAPDILEQRPGTTPCGIFP
jgi:hypothetical protein